MKPHVLLIEPMMPEAEAQLHAAYCVHRLFAAHDRAALIAAIGSSVRAIVTGGAHGASNEIVDALPRLEIIAINGVGTNAVDLQRARARSVWVTTTPDLLTRIVNRRRSLTPDRRAKIPRRSTRCPPRHRLKAMRHQVSSRLLPSR
jgi:lactate dehydrogenase-like 2-hydroxyacid dehydrogenase